MPTLILPETDDAVVNDATSTEELNNALANAESNEVVITVNSNSKKGDFSMKKFTLFFSALLFSMMSFAGVVTFDADADKGNAGTDSNNAAAYAITKDGGII